MTDTPSPDEDRELIDRLRKCADGLPSHGYDWFRGNMWEAADRLESLLSDRAKLEEALEECSDNLEYAQTCLEDAENDAAADFCGRQVAKFRAALNRSTDRG